MKTTPIVIILLTHLAVMAQSALAPEVESRLQRPSDLRRQKTDSHRYSIAFVLRHVPDFRGMYCDPPVLAGRVRAGVCVVDAGAHSVEVNLQKGANVGSVLSGLRNPAILDAAGSLHAPVTVIKKRAILGSGGEEDFLHFPIDPGDFVVIGGVE